MHPVEELPLRLWSLSVSAQLRPKILSVLLSCGAAPSRLNSPRFRCRRLVLSKSAMFKQRIGSKRRLVRTKCCSQAGTSCQVTGFAALTEKSPPFARRIPDAPLDRVAGRRSLWSPRLEANRRPPLLYTVAAPFQPDRPAEPNAVDCLCEGTEKQAGTMGLLVRPPCRKQRQPSAPAP